MKTELSYVIQENAITVCNGETSLIVSKDNESLYTNLKSVLQDPKVTSNGYLNQVMSYYNKYGTKEANYRIQNSQIAEYIENKCPEHFEAKDGLLYLKGDQKTKLRLVNQKLLKTITQFFNDGYPIEPLLRFEERLTELNNSNRSALELLVANGEHPLTWDGKLITYKRSSWGNPSTKIKAWGESFVPGRYETVSDDDRLISSSFQWTASSCPDCGNFYELVVDPLDVLDVDRNFIYSKGYYNLRELDTYTKPAEDPKEVIVLVNLNTTSYGEIKYRNPYTPEALEDFLSIFKQGLKCSLDSNKSEIKLHRASC